MKNGLREDQYSFDAKETRLEIQSSLGPLTQEDCVSQLDEEHTMEHQQPHPEISTAAAYEQTSTETTTQVTPETQNLDATPFDRRSGSVQHYKVYADNVDQLMYLSQWGSRSASISKSELCWTGSYQKKAQAKLQSKQLSLDRCNWPEKKCTVPIRDRIDPGGM